jgi:hypothetical protein
MERVNSWRKRNPEKRKEQKQRERDRKFCRKHNITYDEYILDKESTKIALGIRVNKLTDEEKQIRKLIENAKVRSVKNNLPFDITPDDLNIPDVCPYLGITLNKKNTITYSPNNSTIDRIIPELGYVKNNVNIISMLANSMKNHATIDQLLTFAKNAIKIHG